MTNCVCFVIPPHLTKEIARHAPPAERDRALDSLAISERLKGRRDLLGGIGLGAPVPAATTPVLSRNVFDAAGREILPGTLIRTETGQANHSPMADEAFNGSGLVYNFLRAAFGRNSIDGHGLRLDSTINYGQRYDNAFWEGRQMVYGVGDGHYFNRFTIDPVVIIHESFHGVIQHECNLDYFDQPGACNESISDVMGVCGHHWMVAHYGGGWSFKNANWLVGAGLLTAIVKGRGIRDLAAPGTAYDDPIIGKDPQPAHLKDYVNSSEDGHGVHTNSGIPNHAFFLTCEQLQDLPSWEAAGLIWYQTMLKLRRYSDFQMLATTTKDVAGILFGTRSRQQLAVEKAWGAVGINI